NQDSVAAPAHVGVDRELAQRQWLELEPEGRECTAQAVRQLGRLEGGAGVVLVTGGRALWGVAGPSRRAALEPRPSAFARPVHRTRARLWSISHVASAAPERSLHRRSCIGGRCAEMLCDRSVARQTRFGARGAGVTGPGAWFAVSCGRITMSTVLCRRGGRRTRNAQRGRGRGRQ